MDIILRTFIFTWIMFRSIIYFEIIFFKLLSRYIVLRQL